MAYQRKQVERPKSRRKQLTLRVNDDEYAAIFAYSQKRGITMAMLMDLAVQHYMKAGK